MASQPPTQGLPSCGGASTQHQLRTWARPVLPENRGGSTPLSTKAAGEHLVAGHLLLAPIKAQLLHWVSQRLVQPSFLRLASCAGRIARQTRRRSPAT